MEFLRLQSPHSLFLLVSLQHCLVCRLLQKRLETGLLREKRGHCSVQVSNQPLNRSLRAIGPRRWTT